MTRKLSVVLVAIGIVLVVGGTAWASIPDSNGVIHGCRKNVDGSVRVVDTDAGQTCPNGYTALNWGQVTNTTVVTSSQGSGMEYQPGDGPLTAAVCPSGWKVVAGGWEYNPSQNLAWDTFRVVRDKPVSLLAYPNGWSVRFMNVTDQPQVMSVEVYAICTPVAI